MSAWIEKLARLVREDGLVIAFYNETFGGLLELTWKVVQARHRALTGMGAVESSRALFEAKWSSIPHKRSIESWTWTMDVLENPFVRLAYFVEPVALCTAAASAGLRLYSSWPRYDGGLDVHWFKHEPTAAEALASQVEFIRRSRMSHMFGRRHFLAGADPAMEPGLANLLRDLDALIDGFDPPRSQRCDRALQDVAAALASPEVLSATSDRERSLMTVAMLRRLLSVLEAGNPKAIRALTGTDEAFVASWGTPSHFAVFRRAGVA